MQSDNFSDTAALNALKLNCKDFLDKGYTLYRAMHNEFAIKKFTTNKNRLPRNTNIELHELLNQGINAVFGVKLKSESVFATGSSKLADKYGKNVYLFFPVGKYEVYWSPSIEDLYYLFIRAELKEAEDKELLPHSFL